MGDKILVLCPTRGRVDNAKAIHSTYLDTDYRNTTFMFIVDEDDPAQVDYSRAGLPHIVVPETGSMCGALNDGLFAVAGWHTYDIFGFVGDDHRFRVQDWARMVRYNLVDLGILYGPDGSGNVARQLPTFWFVSRPIVQALGYFALPDCKHFYLDDAWREIGLELGILYYDPDLYIEHRHFSFGKADMDDTYRRTIEKGQHDYARYTEWRGGVGFADDVHRVKSVIDDR